MLIKIDGTAERENARQCALQRVFDVRARTHRHGKCFDIIIRVKINNGLYFAASKIFAARNFFLKKQKKQQPANTHYLK